MTLLIDADDNFAISWDGCDLVIETDLQFYLDNLDDDNYRMVELMVDDRLCDDGNLTYTSSLRYQFTESLEL